MSRFFALILRLFIFLNQVPAYAQSTLESNDRYKDFILDGNNVWLLKTNGILKQVNLSSGQPVELEPAVDSTVVAIARDRKGHIIIADTAHHLKQYDKPTNHWHTIATYSGKPTGLVFDSQNHCLVVTKAGLVDPIKQTTYFPTDSYSGNKSFHPGRKEWGAAPAYFIDSHGYLWLGFNYGEWGGDLFAFDTKRRRYIQLTKDSIQLDLNPVFGFCESPSNVYISGGVSHMFLTHGSILKVKNQTISYLFQSKDRETPVKVTFMEPDGTEKEGVMTGWRGGHHIGPVAYNPADKCLYFYSQLGIYKGSPTSDLSDIKQWQSILNPKLQSSEGQQFAAGPGINVQKMEFTSDGTLFLLANQEGLGIYTQNGLRFIK